MELKKCWKRAWTMGQEAAKNYSTEEEALQAMELDELEDFAYIRGFSEFFHAGFIGRIPEWVEAIRYGGIPEEGFSTNWATGAAEPGVSCVKIIRSEEDENAVSIYDVTLMGREKIRIAGWWLGQSGSDGEPTLLGAVKI